MLDKIKVYRGDNHTVNSGENNLILKQYKVGEIIDFTEENGEENYYSLVNLFHTRSFDVMDILDDMGLDYEETSDYESFLILYRSGKYDEYIHKLFLNECKERISFELSIDNSVGETVLYDHNNNLLINQSVYEEIKEFYSTIHYINKEKIYKAGNSTMKKYRIKQKRDKRQRELKLNKPYESQLLDLVSSVVNSSNGSITFFNVFDLPIMFFMDSLLRIIKIKNHDSTITGLYSGCISSNTLDKSVLDWTGSITNK